MKFNKKIINFCNAQLVLFLLFLLVVAFHLDNLIHYDTTVALLVRIILVTIALLGCALTLALKDYVQNMVQSEATDAVGIHNKKALEKKLNQIQELDDTLDVGIMMFDMNGLKYINDTFGHDEGDRFIKTFASFLTRILTENSFLARYGGDEFVIVQEHTSLDELEKMNMELQRNVDVYNTQAEHEISYAVGYEVSYKNHYYLVQDLMKHADEKMYRDKAFKKSGSSKEQIQCRGVSDVGQIISVRELAGKLFTLKNNGEEHKTYMLLLMDVKDFHLINEFWGYQMGNEILQFIWKRLELFPKVVFTSRFHSDVFVAVVDVTGEALDSCLKMVAKNNQILANEVQGKYPVEYFSMNTGVYYDLNREEDTEKIISHTNTARRKAKEQVDGICAYTEELAHAELLRADVLHSFQSALEKEEFILYFQPKISGKSAEITSAEVLVRWKRADGEIWGPNKFISVLEECGKVEALDFYVYEKAFQWMITQRQQPAKNVTLSLNISPFHFRDIEGFTQKLLDLIQKYQIDTRYLIFEITESAYIRNRDAVNKMISILHKYYIRISMDYFCSGYSSLNTLKDIAFDEVKIDKSFLDGSLTEKGCIVLQEIFHLLKRTGKSIVCEGVETKEAADFLIQEGCDELQGYYYYRPICMQEFEEAVKEKRKAS